jgi:hypothetical protein
VKTGIQFLIYQTNFLTAFLRLNLVAITGQIANLLNKTLTDLCVAEGDAHSHHPETAGGEKFLVGETLSPLSFLPACWKPESVFFGQQRPQLGGRWG